MAEKEHSVLLPRTLCFGLSFFGMLLLALFMFYPAFLSLLSGGGTTSGITEAGWSLPLLVLSLMMGMWFLVGMFVLLRPVLAIDILPEFLKKGLENSTGTSQQFKHGRAFVMGSLAGQVLVWPAAIFASFLFLPFTFGYSGWFPIGGGILGGLFFIALILRLFAPSLLSIFGRDGLNGSTPSAWPFVSGMIVAGIMAAMLGLVGALPPIHNESQIADKRQIGENQTTSRTDEDTRYYITWKGDQSVEIKTTFCANGMSVFLPKDKGFIGKSLDPDSVVYDPYANGTNAIGIGRPATSTRDSASAVANDKSANPDWVRDLGAPQGLGTAYMRGDEKIGSYDFIEGSHIFGTKAFLTSPSGSESETEALLVPTGCTDDDIAGTPIHRQLLSALNDGVTHLVFNLPSFDDGDGYNYNLITDIPVLDLNYSEKIIDEMLKLIAEQGRPKGAGGPPIIMVARWTREQETENRIIEEEKIRKALAARQRSNVTWIAAGQLSPFCYIPQPYCTALNNSTTLYTPEQGSK